jgi:hypothetical protein
MGGRRGELVVGPNRFSSLPEARAAVRNAPDARLYQLSRVVQIGGGGRGQGVTLMTHAKARGVLGTHHRAGDIILPADVPIVSGWLLA